MLVIFVVVCMVQNDLRSKLYAAEEKAAAAAKKVAEREAAEQAIAEQKNSKAKSGNNGNKRNIDASMKGWV